MRSIGHLVIWPLLMLALSMTSILLTPDAAIRTEPGNTSQLAPVRAGVPFVVRDSYATQFCVSTRSGHADLPFVVPAAATSASASDRVQVGVPFVVQDSQGLQICISTRGGQALPPFILP